MCQCVLWVLYTCPKVCSLQLFCIKELMLDRSGEVCLCLGKLFDWKNYSKKVDIRFGSGYTISLGDWINLEIIIKNKISKICPFYSKNQNKSWFYLVVVQLLFEAGISTFATNWRCNRFVNHEPGMIHLMY